MTTIVMIQEDDDVLIAYDSRLTGGDKVESPDHKVFVNGGTIYGMAGPVLYSNAIRYADLPQAPQTDPAKWLTNELLPAIRDVFENIETTDAKRNIGMLIIIQNHVFELSSNLGWSRTTDHKYAIGSGSGYAMGALSAGANVVQAVHIAAKHDECTGDTIRYATANTLLPG